MSDNIILFKKLTSKDLILPSIILKPIFKFFFDKLYFQKKYIIPFRYLKKKKINEVNLWQTRDIHRVLSSSPSSLELNQNEMDVGKKYLILKKIDEKKNFVCFSNRNSVYKGEKIKSIRNASIFTQLNQLII